MQAQETSRKVLPLPNTFFGKVTTACNTAKLANSRQAKFRQYRSSNNTCHFNFERWGCTYLINENYSTILSIAQKRSRPLKSRADNLQTIFKEKLRAGKMLAFFAAKRRPIKAMGYRRTK